ncbi:MAG: hypothetical protein IT582_02955 [Opitutaceae bacterium]|nr:hypothetical protein [Opitutaceae bacterium]
MNTFFILFWVVLILASIAWYAFLVFYVGLKAGREIKTLIRPTHDDQKD